MKNNSYLALLGFAAMASLHENEPERNLTEEQLKSRLNRLEEKRKYKLEKLNINKGLKEFYYGKNKVWAINEKVADKKARKKGYLNNA